MVSFAEIAKESKTTFLNNFHAWKISSEIVYQFIFAFYSLFILIIALFHTLHICVRFSFFISWFIFTIGVTTYLSACRNVLRPMPVFLTLPVTCFAFCHFVFYQPCTFSCTFHTSCSCEVSKQLFDLTWYLFCAIKLFSTTYFTLHNSNRFQKRRRTITPSSFLCKVYKHRFHYFMPQNV